MGNSASSSLPYKLGESVPFQGSFWTLYDGSKKDTAGSKKGTDVTDGADCNNLSIFMLNQTVPGFSASRVVDTLYPVGSRGVSKLKTIR